MTGTTSHEASAPLVSVVIPAFNAARVIARAVHSVLEQDWQPIEVIVVDDGSTDGTVEAVEALGAPELRVIRQANTGAAAARNRGIRESRGAFVAFLDADDTWLPGRLTRTVEPMLADPAIGLCYCRAWREPEGGGPRRLMHAEAVARLHPCGIYPPRYICTPAATVRREVLDRVGLFDESMTNLEDVDLFIRLAEVCGVQEVPEPLVVSYEQPQSLRTRCSPDERARLMIRVTERALARAPERYPHRRGAMAIATQRAGIQFFENGLRLPALRLFMRSMLWRPTLRSLIFVLRTFVPDSLDPVLRRRRRGG